jgi:hypothetical protein
VHRQLHVVEGPRRADLHVDRHLPIRDLAQLVDLDHQIVGSGPVGVATRRALVDARGQRAHPGHARAHLLAQEHPRRRLGALADDDFDGVGLPIVGLNPYAKAGTGRRASRGLTSSWSCRRRQW